MTEPQNNLLILEDAFRLHPASIAAMAEFTLAFLVLIYFFSLKGKTFDTWLLIGYMALASLVYLIDVGVTSSMPPLYSYFRYSHTILVGVWMIFWTWCVYVYRGNTFPREAAGIIVFESMVMVGLLSLIFLKYNPVSYFFNFIFVVIVIHAWAIAVLLRKSVIFSGEHVPSSRTIWRNIVKPGGPTAQTLRAFALIFTCWLAIFISILFLDSVLIYHISQLFLLLGVLLVHLNYASERTTFQVKLVALPLATILALIGILPFLLFGTSAPESDWNGTVPEIQMQLRVFAYLIPGSAGFVILAFIFFYQHGLLRPLNSLLKGVRRIEEGTFINPVPIKSNDEIGSISHSLNKMAASLKASQEELERRVMDRTAELETSLFHLRATQAQLIQSEKMASLGQLTAGIAHEIQNPLNFVNNFSEVSSELIQEIQEARSKVLSRESGNQEQIDLVLENEILGDIKQNLEKINHHGKRADAIVKGMLEHSRAGSGEKVPTDINALADEYLRLSYHGMRAKDKSFNADFKTDFDPDLPKINVVPQDIGRVLLNIINNAFQACSCEPSKGSKPLEGFRPTVAITTKNLEKAIEISVKDNGPGIPDAIKDKIFQPFFTTKPTGQGTGLGLSLSYDIVKAHGGELEVRSTVGIGTEFIINLPIVN